MVKISVYNEDSYEKSLIELFQNMGYQHLYGPDIERDYKNPLYMDDLNILYDINITKQIDIIKIFLLILFFNI